MILIMKIKKKILVQELEIKGKRCYIIISALENFNKSIKMKNKKKLNLSITDTNDNEETIINENDYDDD